MTTVTTTSSNCTSSSCPLCGSSIPKGDAPCPHCYASPQWRDYARAIDFAEREFDYWHADRVIADANHDAMIRRFESRRESIKAAAQTNQPFADDVGLGSPSGCWRCGRPVGSYFSYCNTCGAPLGEGADTFRYLNFLTNEIAHASASELTLDQAHACSAYAAQRAAALRAELERGRLSPEQLARNANKQPKPRTPRRSVMEIILDPRSIQWLLASGGGLLVVGGVIWLASLGIFKNELVVAGSMGTGTLLLLASGIATIKLTRHNLAGRALSLLACLVMPLNLWFYNSHHLVTVDGHLWLAALVCCILYAIAATILEDPVFVYVTSAGIAMTGLLVLADLHKLLEIASPATLLVSLGLIALHAERAFANNDGPFSRKRFGMACFWSAQALLAAGFALLLGAQIAGWLPLPSGWRPTENLITTNHAQRILAVALVIAGIYAYLYSDLVVRRVGAYIYIAAFQLLWAELLLIDLFHLAAHPAALIGAMAITSLAVNLVQLFALKTSKSDSIGKLARPLPAFGMLLASVPAVFGVILHLRATRLDIYHAWPYTVTWSYVAAMAVTAICCRICGYLNKQSAPRLATGYLAATAATTLVGLAGILSLIGVKAWPEQSAIVMLVPMAYLLASLIYSKDANKHPLFTIAHLATVVLAFSAIFSAMNIVPHVEPVVGVQTNLLLALFCSEAALFYAVSAVFTKGARDVYFATSMACASVWQVLNYLNLPTEYYCITFAGLGMALLIAYRAAAIERAVRPALVASCFRCANGLISLSFASAALMTLGRLATDSTTWSLAGLLASFTILSLVAAALVGRSGFRRFYIVVAIIEAALGFIVGEKQLHLSMWQYTEFFLVSVGVILLLAGYIAWYREQERQSDAATFCLLFGSLVAGIPLATAVLINRFWYDISITNELALATIATAMFITGLMCRLRSTTLVGGALLGMHLGMLLVFAGMKAQLAVGEYLALGGAGLFTLGIVLSIHRDRLLALPKKIKQHEGVFSVLAWR
jgi:hypothetical protein